MEFVERWTEALDRRLGNRGDANRWRQVLLREAGRPAPPSTGWALTLGWSVAACWALLAATGLLLLFYYRPTPREAYESVAHVADNVRLGWLVLQLHRWGCHLLVFLFLLLLAREFYFGAYKFPRDWTWCLTVALLVAVLAFGFTGRVLPWDQHAYHATTVATEIMRQGLGKPGEWLCTLLRGGPSISGETLTRFYVLHAWLLPLAFVGLWAGRALLARAAGPPPLDAGPEESSPDPEASGNTSEQAQPPLLARSLAASELVLVLLGTLAVLSPLPLGHQADPAVVPDLLKPEWYFLPLHQLTKYFPVGVCAAAGILIPLGLLLLPFLDRSPEWRPGRRRRGLTLAGFALGLALLLGALGHLSGREYAAFGVRIRFNMAGVPEVLSPSVQK
ncbi:MAG: cytochrome b N-terminal domain-containing protein [Planctomycetes bacterium]|nr:cytochrome b N-terminal domain-containing protein [Planctomycetota bacterium]